MFPRSIVAFLAGCVLFCTPVAAHGADRGPSTPEERKQALDYIRDFEANPIGPIANREREWVVTWISEVPDVHIRFCSSILDRMNKNDRQDGPVLLAAMIMAQTRFALQSPDKHGELIAQYQAGVEGVLRVYEVLLKTKPEDRQPFIDGLIQQRDAGTLADFVKQRANASCRD